MYTFDGIQFPGFAVANLGQFRQTDPFFDVNEFLSFAQGAYINIHHAAVTRELEPVRNLLNESMRGQLQGSLDAPSWKNPILNIVQSSVLSVSHDHRVDTVTVRIAAKSSAKKHSDLVEDWTFTRPAANWQGLDAAPVTQCPSCGAPLTIDERGECHYCKVPIKGVAGDWRLIRTQLVTEKKQKDRSGCAWSWFWVFIIVTTIVFPLVLTGAILWFVRDTTDNAFNSFPKITTPTFNVPSTPATLIQPKQGALKGNITLTSGIKGGFPADTLTFVAADTGTCKDKVAKATGVVATSTGTNEDDNAQVVTITVNLPEGKTGTGTYDDATASVVVAPGPGVTPTPGSSNTWTGPATLTLANNNGTVSLKNLESADPNFSKLSGTVTFTCS